jgi:hypothetical protein
MSAVPWASNARYLAGTLRGSFENGAIDLIDAAIGDENHARAALVALYEGTDTLLQASFDLAESVLCESVLNRIHAADPLGRGEPLKAPENPKRLAFRLARASIENAATV